MLVLWACLGPESMHEKVWIILVLIYFCMHLILITSWSLLFSIIFNFLASKHYMWVQWARIGANMLKKHFFKFLVIYCLIKSFKAL
jgi:hypothetical protein